ncbi:HEAT repeat domain-containing protein [Microcoleus sp. CAWBG58]|uniref:HEAT repeat domain-containing protein n=1 Tax=Microcoleus sp. CAWBG58 TaxID=2841651 RepID=UPI0025EE30F7|nr:HEAT repeat domain-containing protein [Microcoleus sp. CAWBG58]
MQYNDITTREEILRAFGACHTPGKKLELFKLLATRPDPPTRAFFDLLTNKNNHILALAIQAFGQLDDCFKSESKESRRLAKSLSELAQSGQSDLVRWAAAQTIESIGFDLALYSEHLSGEPNQIANKIVQTKLKILTDHTPISEQDEFWDFWTYGPADRLKNVPGMTSEVINELRTTGKIDKSPFSILTEEEIAPVNKKMLERAIYFKREKEKILDKYELLTEKLNEIKIKYPNCQKALQNFTLQLPQEEKMNLEIVLEGEEYKNKISYYNDRLKNYSSELHKLISAYYSKLHKQKTSQPWGETFSMLWYSTLETIYEVHLLLRILLILVILVIISLAILKTIIFLLLIGLPIAVFLIFYIISIRKDYSRRSMRSSRREIQQLENEKNEVLKLLSTESVKLLPPAIVQ